MEATAQRRIARFGIFEADLDSRQLRRSGLRIRLQDQPFQILALLLERQDLVVTREELKEKLWPGNTFVEFDDGLNTAIKKLRVALSDSADNPRFVETVPRIGYRFVAPVSVSTLGIPETVVAEVKAPSEIAPAESIISPVAAPSVTSEPNRAPRVPPMAPAPRRWPRAVAWVTVVMLLVTIGFAITTRYRVTAYAPRSGSAQSIAVLPFLNLSANSSEEYFADGMTDEIITDLAKLGGPKVISRTSVMQYKGTRKTIPDIARELQVGVVMEGSVERSGERLRVRVQLIEGATDEHLWAETYDRQLSDVLRLEADLAQDIARQIQLRLTPKQQQNFAHNRTLNPQAFQDYLQGRHYWALRTNEGLTAAVEYFNRAIQEDSNDARSYAGLAQCYIVLPMFTKLPLAEGLTKARDAAVKAVQLDDSLAEAHLAIAEVRLYRDWDFQGAEQEFKKALELNSNYSTGHQWYGEFLSLMGRHPEAIHELEMALALDPHSAILHLQFGTSLEEARLHGRAIDQYKEAIKIDPKFSAALEALYWIYRRQGKFGQSVQPLRAAWYSNADQIGLIDQLPAAYASAGRNGYLRQCVKIHEHFERPWVYLARDYADLGDRQASLAALNRSYENHELELLWLLDDPEFDSLRSDPRFENLVRKVGFPPRREGSK